MNLSKNIWRRLFNLILCIIFNFISCGKKPEGLLEKLCTKNNDNGWRVENIKFAFKQIYDSETIAKIIIVLFMSLFPNNLLGITINKYEGALIRSLVENLRSFLVWLYFLCVNPEELHENFKYLRLLGMIFVLGSILDI